MVLHTPGMVAIFGRHTTIVRPRPSGTGLRGMARPTSDFVRTHHSESNPRTPRTIDNETDYHLPDSTFSRNVRWYARRQGYPRGLALTRGSNEMWCKIDVYEAVERPCTKSRWVFLESSRCIDLESIDEHLGLEEGTTSTSNKRST